VISAESHFRDALALNVGSDHWQTNQVQNAYNAAQQLGTGFKLFLSIDFTELPCNLGEVVSRVNQFSNHPNQFKINGRVFVSSFSGGCLGDSGWASVKAQTNAYIMPFIAGLEGQFDNWRSLDSWFWYATITSSFCFLLIDSCNSSWGCAWPQGNRPKTVGFLLNQTVTTQLRDSYRQTTINFVKNDHCLFILLANHKV
jgi:glucan endo-1,3-alpha-glucosidase